MTKKIERFPANNPSQDEHKIYRSDRILKGINHIISISLQGTEKELINTCLSEALEITDSQVGFIGEVDFDGLLHEVALSNKEGDQCNNYDKYDHQHPKKDFILNCLYGRVIEERMSCLINYPISCPDNNGMPKGHPSLTSFLGVPLLMKGKAIGVIAVANREAGYTFEQKENLEAIAPAVTQALRRIKEECDQKQAENALHDAYEQFQAQSDELHMQSEELQKANDALMESEKRFRALVTASSEVVYRMSADWSEMYYLQGRKFIPDTCSPNSTWLEKYILPEDQPHVTAAINEAIRTKSIFELEHRVKQVDGTIGWTFSRAVPILDANGEIIEWFGTANNTTERKKAEAKLKETLDNLDILVKERTAELEKANDLLKESEKDLDEAQEMALLGSWKWNIITDELRWSNEVYRIFGLNPHEFKANFETYFKYVHPADREYLNYLIKKVLEGEPYSVDNRIITAYGEERIVHTDVEIIFNEDNIPVYARGIVQDITERKRAEEEKNQLLQDLDKQRAHLQAIVDSLPVGLWIADSTGKIIFINDIARKIWGGKAPFSKNIEEYREYKAWWSESEERVATEDMPLAHAIRGEANIESVVDFERFDGTRGTQLVSSAPIKTSDSSIIGGVAIVQDITERKKAEEFLAKIEIARKQEIHHRIKNNLQVISSLLDLQAEQFRNKEDISDSEVLKAFKESQDRVISMALIHEELHKGGEIDTLNFSQYIKELAENLFKTYRLGNTDISLKLDLEENAFLNMDIAVPLGIIVNELVTNSFKHAFPTGNKGEIRIKLQREENEECTTNVNENCTTFVLTVSDNGIGIPEDIEIENLDTLGMQLIITLVDQLDGEFEIKRDNGSEFTVRFTVTERNNPEPMASNLDRNK